MGLEMTADRAQVFHLSVGLDTIERMFEKREFIPNGLAEMAPGPILAAFLSSFDRRRLNGYDLVEVMRAQARQLAHDHAELMATMVEVAYCAPGGPQSAAEREAEVVEFASDEIRAALVLTRRAADAELDLALTLRQRLPVVCEALHSGDIDVRRARTIVDGTDHLSHDIARRVANTIIDQAGRATTGQIAARIRRLCVELDPDDARSRYEEALDERRVGAAANPDGTASIFGMHLAPDRVSAGMERINHLAQTLRGGNETRTMDQLRADIFVDLLTGSQHTGGRGGVVEIHVDLETLAGLADHAADLDGYGPIIADIARRVASDSRKAQWRTTITDETGAVVWTGTTRRRPRAAQARSVHARHRSCVFPGCRVPARACDLDHTTPWARGGRTSVGNLGPLCRHDHRAKDEGHWRLHTSSNGTFTWTSPLGRTYTTDSHPP